MAELQKQWNNGELLTVAYDGDRDGSATFTSDENESIDREMSVVFVDESRSVVVERTVKQIGLREVFNVAEGPFMVAEGTFNVLKVAPSRLPEGYTELEYLESDGSRYIDTGFKPKYTTRVVLDMSNLTEADKWIFGVKSSSSATSPEQFSICRRTATTIRSDYFGSSVSANMADTTARFTIDVDWNVVKIDGVESIVNTAVTSGTCVYNMYLFGLNIADTSKESSAFRLYSCKIYDNGTLVRDFIPAMNASGEAGLYDLVNDIFTTQMTI